MDIRHNESAPTPAAWPEDSVARVPYWVYQDPENYRRELQRLFEGPTWNFVCLEADIPDKGDFRTNTVGALPVIVVRDADGAINCFENRCAHRGALIALDDDGNVENNFKCIYHAWSYDLCGNLRGIAFERGINGVGGMPKDFKRETFSPRKLRTTTLCGLVFATLSDETPPIEDYLGEEILGRIRRVLNRPITVMGRFTQALPNNWKLYVENVKDTYHASLLHLFFGTFRITRLTQGGGVLVSPDGGHHASYTIDKADDQQSTAYRDQGIRTENKDYTLADPSLLDTVKEFGDDIQLQILSVFPGFILQQIHNCLAVRQVVPRGTDRMDLKWTYFGFADDSPEMTRRRLKQQNLVGPAGFVSMEDGCVGGFVQRGIASAGDQISVIEMGGDTTQSQATRATEASVRGFWKAYRDRMGYDRMDVNRLVGLNAAYARAIDNEQFEQWPKLFHTDCLYKVTTAENVAQGLAAGVMYADSRAMLQDRVSALRTANIYERQRYRHIVGLPVVLAETDGMADVETPFLIVRIMRDGTMDVFATGCYRDKIKADATGDLRFVERIAVCDGSRFDTLVAIPF